LLNIPASTLPLLKSPQTHPHAIATLTDLGLSRRIPAPPESPLLTTRCGSEDYAAPEILLGQPYDGRATDAWALGVLLYALMEGRLPFDPPPGKPARGRAVHRIARCDWVWVKFGDEDGEWDAERGKDWAGARECVEGLLKKASRGRKPLDEIEQMEWVQQGIQVEGGLKNRPEDDVVDDNMTSLPSRWSLMKSLDWCCFAKKISLQHRHPSLTSTLCVEQTSQTTRLNFDHRPTSPAYVFLWHLINLPVMSFRFDILDFVLSLSLLSQASPPSYGLASLKLRARFFIVLYLSFLFLYSMSQKHTKNAFLLGVIPFFVGKLGFSSMGFYFLHSK
jgi:serine/threonine protein kinase